MVEKFITLSRKIAVPFLIMGALFAGLFLIVPQAHAATGTNQQMNFQGRLFNAQGAVVPDGYYNIQFKIYQDGDGQTAGDATGSPAGSLKWTESWLNNNSQGVQVKNGFVSVQLGSISAFGSNINWNSDTLWLSMNIGNTNATCTPFTSCGGDGEMVPMKRLSSAAYALNSSQLGGLSSAQFLQFAQGLQTDASTNTSSIAINKTGTGNLLQLQSSNADAFVINNSGDLNFGAAGNHTISIATPGAGIAGKNLTVTAGAANASGTGATGGTLVLQGGNAAGTGNNNGGNITIAGGAGTGTGAQGIVNLSASAFTSVTNATCSVNCTITQSNVDGFGTVMVGASAPGLTITLPAPTIASAAGRILYVTAQGGSQDFSLAVNTGGNAIAIAMRQNTTATMIWNGSAWTAAGASSSTTLQSAYDNTLQSAGGAELVVSKTSATNGLTIRDSTAKPVNGTLFSVQTSSAAGLLSVNSNVTEYSSDSGAEVAGGGGASTFPAGTWTSVGSAAVSRYTTAGNYIAAGQASTAITTTAAANDGLKNTLNTTLTSNTHYNVSFTARLGSGTFTDMSVYYSADGTASSVACKTGQAIPTSVWTKVNCTFTAPASGMTANNAILIQQATGVARTFYVDNISVTIAADYNYASDGGVDDATNFGTNWTPVGSSAVSRTTSVGNDASDSAQVVTTAANQGVRNKLSISPLTNTLYRISVYVASSTSGFNNFTMQYSPNGGTSFTNCADYNTQTVSSSLTSFTQITCYITTDGTAPSNPYVYFTQTDSTGRTFYVDTFAMTIYTSTTPNIQIGGGINGGPATLLTLDRAASAPIASNNDALLGSMYYDTTLGKLQCYESGGWGACGSSPNNIVTISPEYTNAVLYGSGVGTMTSTLCSASLNINDGTSGQPTICGANETYNFYRWTSPQASAQTYGIYVTYQLPSTFKSFASGQTSIMGRTDSSNAAVQYQIYRNNPATGLTACGSAVSVSSGSVASWQTGVASGAADPSTCGFAPGNSIVFKINATASQNANAYIGNLNFTFSNR